MKIQDLIKTQMNESSSDSSLKDYTIIDYVLRSFFSSTNLSIVDDAYITAVGDISQYMDLDNVANIQLSGLDNLTSLKGMPVTIDELTLTRLKKIRNLDDMSHVTKIDILSVGNCDNLSDITLHCDEINGIHVSHTPSLKHIDITNVKRLNYSKFTATECDNLESVEANDKFGVVRLEKCPKLMQNPQNLKIKCDYLNLYDTSECSYNFSNLTCSTIAIHLLYPKNLSKLMITNGLTLVKLASKNNDADDVAAIKYMNESLSANGNIRSKLMKFTQLMTNAGLEHML